ncbi:hypothetical protein [Streptomyces luteireticuli]|uniref:MBL fold metallo-hydrolase n=1 Tax=Streptomyces luteireticuli TaxID=173858 RepID=A0ABP3IQR2_9ACTN
MPVEVIFFNVGQGDCTFLWFYDVVGGGGGAGPAPLANRQGRAAALIDCGSLKPVAHRSTVGQPGTAEQRMVRHIDSVIADRLQRNAGAKQNVLDYLFLSHADADHFNQLGSVLGDSSGKLKYRIENVWYTGEAKEYKNKNTSFVYRMLKSNLRNQLFNGNNIIVNPPEDKGLFDRVMPVPGIPELSLLCSRLVAKIGSREVTSTVPGSRNSTSKNASSLVLMLSGETPQGSTDRQKVLLMADAETGVEQFLMDSDRHSGNYSRTANLWLKAGHHGSAYATSTEWLEHTTPDAVFFSSGTKVFGPTGMPSGVELERIEEALDDSGLHQPDITPPGNHHYGFFDSKAKPKKFDTGSTSKGICTSLFQAPPPAPAQGEWLGVDWHLILDDPQPGGYHLEYV